MKIDECNHYIANCLIKFECCQKMYPCKRCHDEQESHKTHKNKIKKIICANCNYLQDKTNVCLKCHLVISTYFCSECNIWDSSGENIFHCKKCSVCRKGDINEIVHCDYCQVCISGTDMESHTHVENATGGNCPICAESFQESTETLVLLSCGHPLHRSCFNTFILDSHVCPICLRSAGDVSEMNKKIEELLSIEIKNSKIEPSQKSIKCYDCNHTSEIKDSFIYSKCQLCESYNTRVMDFKH